jgi:hypothetical protein
MEEQGGKEGEEGWNRIKSIAGKQYKEFIGDDTKMEDETLEIWAEGYLVEKDHNIDNY